MTDSELLLELRQGSRAAFNILYNKYWKKVYNAAYKRVNDREIAEDITQDIFVQLWTRNADIIITDLPSYLNIAARNGVFKRMGKEGKYIELPEELHNLENLTGADSNVLHKEFLAAFNELVETLPEQQRIIFKLKFYDNLSSQEIAEQLNLSPKTVRNHIGRALATLKSEILLLQLLLIFYYK